MEHKVGQVVGASWEAPKVEAREEQERFVFRDAAGNPSRLC